jgi:rhodanese-related sulfurtransferase
MTKVTADTVKEWFAKPEGVTVVDSRSDAAWDNAETKAAAAIRVPPTEAERHIADVNRADRIVVYCT